MQQRDKLFINGKWVAAHGTGSIEVIHSATEAVMGKIPEGHARDAEDAIAAARAAFDGWAATPPAERARYIRKIAEGLKDRTEELAQLKESSTSARRLLESTTPGSLTLDGVRVLTSPAVTDGTS